MKLRIIILVLAILAILSAFSGGLLYYYSLRHAALKQAENSSKSRLKLLNRQLNTYLSEHVKPVKALAGLDVLKSLFDGQSSEVTMEKGNHVLDNFARALDLEVCYLIDLGGTTIASSNRNAHDSFVGRNFAFRPYFIDAAAGVPGRYLALGTTSRKRGVYYSHPVLDRHQNEVVGVAVVKASVERIESQLFVGSDGILLVTDPNGVIFISNLREMRFMLLWELDREEIKKINETRQFGSGPWLWTGFSRPFDDMVRDRNGQRYLYFDMPLEKYPGWQIVQLKNIDVISRQLSDPFIHIIGPIILVIAGFIAVSVLVLYRKALHELIRRRQLESELRASEARYRHIYHKTPVMLHSIDTQGVIIRVSDFWLQKMAYHRDEVIGKKLTDFYTPESKQYAEDVVFPVFFKTGFCEEIPYTYVNRMGEKIESLLSCYGVRDEEGKVVRSLAVSVDVTEKNQVQHDLEKAREKLSRYSQDLELQVAQRTDELRKTQDQLRRLSSGIMAAHENERRAISRELHDHLGQMLTALKMDVTWIEKYLTGRRGDKDKKASARAAGISNLIDETIGDVREMAFRLRPGVLDDLGLVDALELMTREFEKRSEVSCRFRCDAVPELDDTINTALYRIAQEAVTNALRHSGSTDILVALRNRLEGGLSMVMLRVEDNGCGLSDSHKGTYQGLGLTGMRERATLAGGELRIVSTPGQGTVVECCLFPDRFGCAC